MYNFSDVFSRDLPARSNVPRLNDFTWYSRSANRGSSSYSNNYMTQKQRFWSWFKTRPELNAPVTAKVNDTITDVYFTDINDDALGAKKRNEAKTFWESNLMDETLKAIWLDTVTTGTGFGWIGTISPIELTKCVDDFLKLQSNRISVKESGFDFKTIRDMLALKTINDEAGKPRTFAQIASSSVMIGHDGYAATNYIQTVGTTQTNFKPSEVIQFNYMNADGHIDGWSPVESMSSEMLLLYLVKENMISYVRNGGSPDSVFVLPKEIANSQNHEYLKDLLMNQGALENRHGNLVLTGEVNIQKIREKVADMEYQNLALWITSNIAYGLHVPVSRIPYMIGKAQSAGDAGGLADAGYWSEIYSDQRKIENLLNNQIFRRLGIKVHFRKAYKIDDLRAAQSSSMKADTIVKMQNILGQYGKKLSLDKIMTTMDLGLEDVKENDMPGNAPVNNTLNQNQLSNGELKNPDQQKKNSVKRDAAMNDPNQSQNPSG